MLLTANGTPQKMSELELAARVLKLSNKMFLLSTYTFISTLTVTVAEEAAGQEVSV